MLFSAAEKADTRSYVPTVFLGPIPARLTVRKLSAQQNKNQTIFEAFPDVEFYDYTKIGGRKAKPDENYSLTFSRSEDNEKQVAKAMNRGQNVAVVFGERVRGFKPRLAVEAEETHDR